LRTSPLFLAYDYIITHKTEKCKTFLAIFQIFLKIYLIFFCHIDERGIFSILADKIPQKIDTCVLLWYNKICDGAKSAFFCENVKAWNAGKDV